MRTIESFLNVIINFSNNIIWGYILIYLLIGVGIYFSVRLRLIQFRHFSHTFKLLFTSRKVPKGQLSSFQAFCTSLGSRVGSGNIAGVAVAIYLGGPGAVFWMWVIALLGMATSFIEATLAQLYKTKNANGTYVGGPAYYIEKGLKSRFWGIVFACSLILAFGLVFNAVQANTMVAAVNGAFGIDKGLLAVIIGIATAVVIMGGIVRISRFSEVAVPFMAFMYILLAIIVVALNYDQVPSVFKMIFLNAFGLEVAGSGLLGYTIGSALENGVKRGLFSNEAGMGSAANAAATASPLPKHPAAQGYIQMFGVFVDTIIICTITALIVLLSGVFTPGNDVTGIALAQVSLANEIGGSGNAVLAILLIFFAFTSIVANYSYAESNILYISRNKYILHVFRVFVVAMVMFGSVSQVALVWNMADTSMGIMAIINLVAILLLSKIAIDTAKDYNRQLKLGQEIQFKSDKYEAWH